MTSTTIELGDGACYFRLLGPDNGPLLLLLHGATVPGWEFDRIVPLLNAAGWRTLVPDLYGHGYSARPRTDYDYALFERQITGLLAALDISRPIPVFGHSMGAALAARLVNQRPERFERLVMAAPLLDFASTSLLSRIFALPGVGEILMPVLIKPMLMRRRAKRYRNIEDGRWVGLFRQHIDLPGFGHALLSMFRCGTLGDQSKVYRELAQQSRRKVLVLRGSDDNIMPREHLLRIYRLLPRAQYIEVPATPHAFVITDPEKLVPAILEFLAPAAGSSASGGPPPAATRAAG